VIGRLRGRVVTKQPPFLLLDVNGVGYEVEATMGTFYALPGAGSECTVYTHLVVREDAHQLFGFASEEERSLFRSLIRVNGIGARLALTILSGMSVQSFSRCVHEQDHAALTRLPGVGRKTAERIVIEMRDRLETPMPAVPGSGAAVHNRDPIAAHDPVSDAVSALAALGYKPHEASRMVREVNVSGLSSEEIIRNALQTVVK